MVEELKPKMEDLKKEYIKLKQIKKPKNDTSSGNSTNTNSTDTGTGTTPGDDDIDDVEDAKKDEANTN